MSDLEGNEHVKFIEIKSSSYVHIMTYEPMINISI